MVSRCSKMNHVYVGNTFFDRLLGRGSALFRHSRATISQLGARREHVLFAEVYLRARDNSKADCG